MADDILSAAAAAAPSVPPGGGGIASLKDFTDVNKLADPAALKGLSGGLGDMASKMKDLGAKFKNPADAAKMFNSISVPNVPSFNGAFSGLDDMIAQHQPKLDELSLGTSGVPCTGPMGLPSLNDFMAPVAGSGDIAAVGGGPITGVSILSGEGPSDSTGTVTFDAIECTSSTGTGATVNITVEDGVYTSVSVASGGADYTVSQELTVSGYGLGGTSPENDLTITVTSIGSAPLSAEQIQKISDMCDRATGLFEAAGIDLDATPKAPTLSSLIKAATSLHKIGAESNGIGSADTLKSMIPSGSMFGDAIKTAMAEGQNLKAMAAAGIKPPQFNPFEGLPAGGDADLSTASAQKMLGG